MENSIGKDSHVIWELQIKYHHTPNIIEWLKIPNADSTKCWEHVEQKLSFLLVGMQKGVAPLGGNLAVSYKSEHNFNRLSSSCTLRYYPNLCP